MYGYFETDDAVYFFRGNKYFKHLKVWNSIPGFQYHNIEISLNEYVRAYRGMEG